MKVKIGNRIFDSNNEPIMIILGEQDRNNIKNMHENATKYCCYPSNLEAETIENFMEIDKV